MPQAMLIAALASLTLASDLLAQDSSGDADTTAHSIQFVTVDDNVKLEVLDWGGSGRPMILLHGGNSTAHEFDQFAPKLKGSCHVYGITRRGSGTSSVPPPTDANYSADRLGDDVLAVIEDLHLVRPVLVGHSLGGQELSSVGSRYPGKVAGLIYLDAAYQYAYYNRSKGFLDIEVNEVRRKLEQLEPGKRPPDPRRLIDELLQTSLPELERTLRQIQERFKNAPQQPRDPTHPLPPVPPLVAAISRGSQRYTHIGAPILAIYAFEAVRDPDGSPARVAVEKRNEMKRDQAAAFEAGVPSARVVRLNNASHDVFRSNEPEVLREMNDFIRSLPTLDGSPKP
jgi:pimeloyl-ACP methyl ester carboxylesterase